MSIQIIGYRPELQPYFERFNKAWLEKYFVVEPIDAFVLEHPQEAILKDGGDILFAQQEGEVIGTVALRFREPGIFEMTKMAVSDAYKGNGAGKLLCKSAINKAKSLGASKLILYSNKALPYAVDMYGSFGFNEIPLQPGTYGRADIMMELQLN